MPQYQFRCDSCRVLYTVEDRNNVPPCPTCGLNPKRVWSFTNSNSMPEHFNHSLGEYVSNRRQFYDGLKRASEEASVRTGIEHNFQPLDPSDLADPSAHGVTDEGMEETHRAHYEERKLLQ